VFLQLSETEILTVKVAFERVKNCTFCAKNDAAIKAALKIPIFTGKAILVNYFASAPG
jgi:hypothetical protein